jgi:hypothetical protein
MRPASSPNVQPFLRPLSLLLLACLGAGASGAAEFSGSTTTTLRVYDLIHSELLANGQPIQRVISYRPVDQDLRLTWDDIGERGAWSVDLALRFRWDVGSGKAAWQTDDLDVLLAQARWRSQHGALGLTLGRQQSITGFGWHSFDGVRLGFDKSPHVKAFVIAGFPVELWEGGASMAGGRDLGAGITAVLPKHGSIGWSYERRSGDSTLLDFTTGQEATHRGVLLDETATMDARFRWKHSALTLASDYSLLLASFGETTAVLDRDIGRKHHVEARLSRVEPLFPSDSIFNVYDVNPYDEGRVSYEFRGDGPLDVGGYVSYEHYKMHHHDDEMEPPPDPNDVPDDLPPDIRRAGATLRWEGRHEAIHRSEIGWIHGWTGNRLALQHDSDWGLNPRWRVGVGASVHSYENRYRLTESDEVYGLRGRIRHDHDGKWDLALEVEQWLGRDRNSTRATLVFGTRFGKARGEMPWWGGRWNWSRPTHAPAIPSMPAASEAEAQ